MTPHILMKSRVNTAFLMMTLTLAVQSAVSLPSTVFVFLAEFGIEFDAYYTDFVLLQTLYPLATCLLAVLTLRLIRIPFSSVVRVQPLKGDFFPWLGLFLGVTVVMNYAVNFLVQALDWIGIHLPDLFASYEPQDPLQATCYFVVLAILPPVTEEILCRASVGGVLKHFHPWTAVLVSAFAFAMMHATVQQIPFAFVLGLVLGFVYVKTGNFLYPVLLHFANNAFACVMTYLSVWGGEELAVTAGYCADGLFLLAGIVSAVFLLLKKRFTLREIPRSLSGAEAWRCVVRSPWFWVFTGLYAGLTALMAGLLSLSEPEVVPLSLLLEIL